MKKVLFFLAFTSLFFISCSKDEDTAPASGSLIIKTLSYTDDPEEFIKYYEYSQGKLLEVRKYNADNLQTGKITYTYLTNGLLESIKTFTGSGSNPDKFIYIYDGDKRLINLKWEPSDWTTENYYINYTYSDNLITAIKSGDVTSTKIYTLNNDGIIFKEETDEGTKTVTYDGVNPTSATDGTIVTTFEYDEIQNANILPIKNPDDIYKPNEVLRTHDLINAATGSANKYLIKKTVGADVYTFNYTFNDYGLPIRRLEYYNGTLVLEADYIYK